LVGDLAKVSNTRVHKEIQIMPGMRDGTELRFVGWGNDPAIKRAGDLVVILRRAEHKTLEREGDDLIYKHKISLADALTSAPVQFETLDGEIIKYRPDEVINPTS
jgi:DnaJ-class molecular chaperone